MPSSFSDLLENSSGALYSSNSRILNTVIPGSIIAIRRDMAVIDVGLKSEGVIPLSEFKNSEGVVELQVGDCVGVLLKSIDDGLGHTSISRLEAIRLEAIKQIKAIFASGDSIEISITATTKGGLLGSYRGVGCFVPGSLIDTRPVRDFNDYLGQNLEVKIIKIDDGGGGSLVCSRKAILLASNDNISAQVFKKLKVGDLIDGEVKVLAKFGAFVDVGGLDGLIHISDLSWNRVSHPNEVLKEGQQVKVKILSLDADKGRLSLGLKQATPNPWDNEDAYPIGKSVSGVVNGVTDFGCFVSIDGSNGLAGLVHMSELSWENVNICPSNVVRVGDKVQAVIISHNFSKKKIALSIKQVQLNPLDLYIESHQVGEAVLGKIQATTDFGCFVELSPAVVGLLHVSKIYSSHADYSKLGVDFTKGSEINVVLAQIDIKNSKIGLGLPGSVKENTYETPVESQEDKKLLDSYRNSDTKGSLGDYLKK